MCIFRLLALPKEKNGYEYHKHWHNIINAFVNYFKSFPKSRILDTGKLISGIFDRTSCKNQSVCNADTGTFSSRSFLLLLVCFLNDVCLLGDQQSWKVSSPEVFIKALLIEQNLAKNLTCAQSRL